MLIVLLPLLLALVVAALVLAVVAIPARREGRDVLTPRGEVVIEKAKAGSDAAAARTGELVASAVAKIRPGDAKAVTDLKG